jgi:chromatin segregation and condensation protein Rec8/ScpA/Scc1 (kleisin family)
MLREMLRQLPDLAKRLEPRVTVEELERGAGAQTDTVAVLEMQRAKQDVRQLSKERKQREGKKHASIPLVGNESKRTD